MKSGMLLAAFLVFALLSSVLAFETGIPFQIREDYGSEPLFDTYLNYYYYIPCPTTSWFWQWFDWTHDDIIGAWFEIGDVSMGTGRKGDPVNCHMLEQIRVLDYAGYSYYADGAWAVRFDVWCADELGCPVGPSLWNSGWVELHEVGWNYLDINPPISICSCSGVPGPVPSSPRILVTATHVGWDPYYPAWGTDNISAVVSRGCVMHDNGCLPALYPRPYSSHYESLHSGYYGNASFQYCPAQPFKDGLDSTRDGTQYGFVELAWRVYLNCTGPSGVEPTTWGAIKSIYR